MKTWLGGILLGIICYAYLSNRNVVHNNSILSKILNKKTVLICGASSGLLSLSLSTELVA